MKRRLLALDTTDDISVEDGLTVIGRHPTCDYKIRSARISRVHCCLYLQGDRLFVRDLNSTNGVKINGRSILKGEIRSGDVLSVAQFHFKCVDGDEQGEIDRSIDVVEESSDRAVSALSAQIPLALNMPIDPHESSLEF